MKKFLKHRECKFYRQLGHLLIALFFIITYSAESIYSYKNNEVRTDFACFWSAGKVVDQYGYDKAYNYEILFNEQINVFESYNISGNIFCPVPYQSVFLIPFRYFSRLELKESFWLWTILNWVIFLSYTVYFLIKNIHSRLNNEQISLIIAVIFSYPVFSNFIWGQMEVLLYICFGEFILNSVKKNELIAGLWLGILIIKPQILIFIIPALLVQKNYKVLVGAVLSGLFITSFSITLSGIPGLIEMIKQWLGSYPGTAPAHMMNWRMVGLNLQNSISPFLSWMVTALGMSVTLLLCYRMINKKHVIGTDNWILSMCGVVAATLIFSWHSHIHMVMSIIPFFIMAIIKGTIPKYLIDYWVFIVGLIVMFFGIILNLNFGENHQLMRLSPFLLNYVYLILTFLFCIRITSLQTVPIPASKRYDCF